MVFCIIGFYYENEEKGMDKMARKTKYEIRTLKTETDDVNQYNALLRYAFQVTEQELAETGWRDDEIKQSKFPVLDRADVLGCFDGKTLISQFAVYPLKMNIYDTVFQIGFVTSVCTYPEYSGHGIMKKLMVKSLTNMRHKGQSFALLYPYSIPLYHKLGWEIVSNKISYTVKDRQIPAKATAPGYVRRVDWPEIEGLVYSECSHPMELLGAHMCRDGMLVQVFRPDAVEAEIHIAGRKKAYACEKVDESGYFAVCIPIKKQTAYTVCIEDIKGQKKEYMDPYACGTALTAEQRKKLAAGDDWEAYRLFGAHERTVGGIRGVCFAVWAPNAQRVSVVGDFNHWDGRIFPMEKHEDSGIFELFIPEMKAGTAYKYEIKFKGGNIAVKTDPYCRQCDAGQGFRIGCVCRYSVCMGRWCMAEGGRKPGYRKRTGCHL